MIFTKQQQLSNSGKTQTTTTMIASKQFFVSFVLLAVSLATTNVAAYSLNNGNNNAVSRRSLGGQVFRGLLAGTLAANTLSSGASVAVADNELIDVYYGVGCFWHIQ
jgi:hypothetical protein